jgi:hypothetical protein
MTRQASFKRRVRARMEKTGEKYTAARRALIEKADRAADRQWISEPEHADAVIQSATGRTWDQWRDTIEAELGGSPAHQEIVAVAMATGLDGWWSQSVAVGYERITGMRLPNQLMDGTFTAGKSKTMELDVAAFRELLLDADARSDLFPGFDTELRSKPGSKAIRVGLDDAVVLFSFDPAPSGRTRLTVTHEQLGSPGEVDVWKKYWGDWLEAVAAG